MADSSFPLRPLRRDDLDLVRQWRNHTDVRRFMYTQHEIDAEEHHAWYERVQHDESRYLLIFEPNGWPTGFINFHVVDSKARRAEWGFYLAPDAPQGSGRELGLIALEYAFENLGVHKVCGEAIAYNMRSIRFHERLGFTHEATLRDHHFDGDTYHDVIGFGLLVTDWSEIKEDANK